MKIIISGVLAVAVLGTSVLMSGCGKSESTVTVKNNLPEEFEYVSENTEGMYYKVKITDVEANTEQNENGIGDIKLHIKGEVVEDTRSESIKSTEYKIMYNLYDGDELKTENALVLNLEADENGVIDCEEEISIISYSDYAVELLDYVGM